MPSLNCLILKEVKPGDKIVRMLAGTIPMELIVTEVTETEILCGARDEGYLFDRKTGAEIDEEIGWGPPPKITGSYLRVKVPLSEVLETKNEYVQSAKK